MGSMSIWHWAIVIVVIAVIEMTSGDFFGACRANGGDGAGEDQRHAGQRVIAVEHHLVVGDFGDAVEQDVVLVAALGQAFKLHADL